MTGASAARRDYAASRSCRGVIPRRGRADRRACEIEPGKRYGFFTDTTLCIGCKACEVACKEWNQLPADDLELTRHSYDNTGDSRRNDLAARRISSSRWRCAVARAPPRCRRSRATG